jgi:hypothetical protein
MFILGDKGQKELWEQGISKTKLSQYLFLNMTSSMSLQGAIIQAL